MSDLYPDHEGAWRHRHKGKGHVHHQANCHGCMTSKEVSDAFHRSGDVRHIRATRHRTIVRPIDMNKGHLDTLSLLKETLD